MEFGDHLKQWRSHRHMSQMNLALEAGISSRHLSFLETGRARPSEGMIIRICEALELPFKIQNELFGAAGFAPRYLSAEREGVAGLPVLIRDTLNMILERHAPWPAVAFNADHDILAANVGFMALAGTLGIPVAPGVNILALVLDPGPVRRAVANWPEVALLFLKRARNEARLYGPKSQLAKRIADYESNAEISALLRNDESERNPPPIITVKLHFGDAVTNWITTLTAFGTAQEVLTEGIFIEQYFPADDATRVIAGSMGR
ncbi:Transcriptional regulator, contains XRE-family HTH domain [Phyllobacterium sp. OV277]|nr:Transcriptional regulator, contains XRE-family HTH domain [Phyllobacterium sp. OV277]